MSLWKKILLGIGLFFLLCLLFWKTIYTTFLYVGIENVLLEPRGTTTYIPIERAVLPAENVMVTEMVDFLDLSVPMLFTPTTIREGTTTLAYITDEQSVVIFEGMEMLDIFLSGSESSTLTEASYRATTMRSCKLLQALHPNVCDSNYEFLKAILETNEDSVSLFSSKAEKLAYVILGILKSVYVPSTLGQAYLIQTDEAKGFTYESINNNGQLVVIAQMFLPNDRSYEFIFKGLAQGEVDYILSNIRTQQ